MRRLPTLALTTCALLVPAAVDGHGASAARDNLAAPAAKPVVGMLNIPRLKINVPIRVGTTNAVFDIGVGQYPGTARPGAEGNMVIGGHRTSAKKPFAKIDTMRKGDPIIVTAQGRTYTYVVTRTFVVKPNAMWITDPTPDAQITLFACHPRGSVSKRYVVRGALQG